MPTGNGGTATTYSSSTSYYIENDALGFREVRTKGAIHFNINEIRNRVAQYFKDDPELYKKVRQKEFKPSVKNVTEAAREYNTRKSAK